RGQAGAGKPGGPEPAAKGDKNAQAAMSWNERLAIKAPDDATQAFNVAVSPDGKTMAVCYGTVTTVLDATNGKELVTLSGTEKGYPRGIAFSPDGKLIAQSGDEHDVLLCSADSGQVTATLEVAKAVYAVAFSPGGKTLAAACGNREGGEVRLWDLA